MTRRHLKKTAAALALLACAGTAAAADAPQLEYYNQGNQPGRPFSLAVRAGDYVYLSGQLGTGPAGLVPGFRAQSRKAMDNISTILRGMNLSMDNVVKCTVMIAGHGEVGATLTRVYVELLQTGPPAGAQRAGRERPGAGRRNRSRMPGVRPSQA
jgi:2-iminobutanoate/2-iminopropanoate deaminase